MLPPRPRDGSRVVVLSGPGISAASEIPGYLDVHGLWEGRKAEDVANTQAWWRDRETVRRFYDMRRVNCVHVLPNLAHEALARLQHRWGARRVVLVTHTIDGLLHKAGAADVIEMAGSLWMIACEEDDSHPHIQIAGPQNRDRKCSVCGATMRPDVLWFGEQPRGIDRIEEALKDCDLFLAVGTTGTVWPAAQFMTLAHESGARCVEINPAPSGEAFDEVITRKAEEVLPEMVAAWLGETG